MIQPREHVILIHAMGWISLHPTWRRCRAGHMGNCSRAPNQFCSQLSDVAGVFPLGLSWKFPWNLCISLDKSSIVCRLHLCHGTGSIWKCYFSIYNRYIWSGKEEYPGAADLTHFAQGRAKPLRSILPLCLGLPLAVIQGSLLDSLLPATPAAAPCSPVQCLVPISPLEMLCTVTPSSPIQTLTVWKKVQTTSSLASWSSKALALSIEISRTLSPPSEQITSLAMIQVHSWGIPRGMPGPLPHHPLIRALHSQKFNALQVYTNCQADSASNAAATLCTNKLPERITHLSHPIGTVWQADTVYSHVGIRPINWTSTCCKYMLNSFVSWVCPDIQSASPVHHDNPGYKLTSHLQSYKPSSNALECAQPYSNDHIRWSNQVLIVITKIPLANLIC